MQIGDAHAKAPKIALFHCSVQARIVESAQDRRMNHSNQVKYPCGLSNMLQQWSDSGQCLERLDPMGVYLAKPEQSFAASTAGRFLSNLDSCKSLSYPFSAPCYKMKAAGSPQIFLRMVSAFNLRPSSHYRHQYEAMDNSPTNKRNSRKCSACRTVKKKVKSVSPGFTRVRQPG